MALGKNVIKIREAQQLTQSEMIRRLKNILPDSEHEKLQGAISNMERRDSTTSKYIESLAIVLNTPISTLLSGETAQSTTVEQLVETYQTGPYQISIKDLNKTADNNPAMARRINELLTYFVAITEKHQKTIISLCADFYDTDSKLKEITRRRSMPEGIVMEKKHGKKQHIKVDDLQK
ncbi:MAG: helix-turn-helix domain-containing protein [Methylophilaceae bacterium]